MTAEEITHFARTFEASVDVSCRVTEFRLDRNLLSDKPEYIITIFVQHLGEWFWRLDPETVMNAPVEWMVDTVRTRLIRDIAARKATMRT